MPMQVESLEVLEKADVAPAQARAIIRAIEIEIAGARDTLATRQDLAPLVQDVAALKLDVGVLKLDVAALKQDVGALKLDVGVLKQDVGALKLDVGVLKQDVGALKQDVGMLKQDVAAVKQDLIVVKQDVATLRQELRHGLEISRKETSELGATLRGELRAEIHASASGVTRQMYVAVLGQMAVLLGFAYFFTTHMR